MAKLLHTIDAILGVKDQTVPHPSDNDAQMSVLRPAVVPRLWPQSGVDASEDEEHGTTYFLSLRVVAIVSRLNGLGLVYL